MRYILLIFLGIVANHFVGQEAKISPNQNTIHITADDSITVVEQKIRAFDISQQEFLRIYYHPNDERIQWLMKQKGIPAFAFLPCREKGCIKKDSLTCD
jgi:hypothetical protein